MLKYSVPNIYHVEQSDEVMSWWEIFFESQKLNISVVVDKQQIS
jgi:hypothetical protein